MRYLKHVLFEELQIEDLPEYDQISKFVRDEFVGFEPTFINFMRSRFTGVIEGNIKLRSTTDYREPIILGVQLEVQTFYIVIDFLDVSIYPELREKIKGTYKIASRKI